MMPCDLEEFEHYALVVPSAGIPKSAAAAGDTTATAGNDTSEDNNLPITAAVRSQADLGHDAQTADSSVVHDVVGSAADMQPAAGIPDIASRDDMMQPPVSPTAAWQDAQHHQHKPSLLQQCRPGSASVVSSEPVVKGHNSSKQHSINSSSQAAHAATSSIKSDQLSSDGLPDNMVSLQVRESFGVLFEDFKGTNPWCTSFKVIELIYIMTTAVAVGTMTGEGCSCMTRPEVVCDWTMCCCVVLFVARVQATKCVLVAGQSRLLMQVDKPTSSLPWCGFGR